MTKLQIARTKCNCICLPFNPCNNCEQGCIYCEFCICECDLLGKEAEQE